MRDPDTALESLSPTQRKLLGALQERLAAAPLRSGPDAAHDPIGPVEEHLTAIWSAVLGRDNIGRHDNYFQLGGDSVRSIQIVAQARRLGLPLTTRKLLEFPTIALLTRALQGGTESVVAAETGPATLTGRFALTPMQAGVLYECLASPQHHLYQSCIVLDARGALDTTLLRLAWNKLLISHAALRTRFEWSETGPPQQVVAEQIPCELLEEHCNDDLRVEEACARLKQRMRAEIVRLDVAPLCRIAVLHIKDDHHLMVLVHHHLILDGWSQQILLGDLLCAYFDYLDGRASPCVQSPSFQSFVEKNCLYNVATSFWIDYLRGHVPVQTLTRTSSEATTHSERLELEASVAAGLAHLAADAGVTFATVFQGLWALALAEASGRSDIVYGLVVSGRDTSFTGSEDLTRIVGMCVNTVPLRVSVGSTATFADWLGRLRTNILDLMPYQYAPLPAIKRDAVGAATPRLFESLVVIENLPGVPFHDDRLSLTLRSYEIEEGWPIVAVVHPGDTPVIELRTQPGHCSPGLSRWLANYIQVAMRTVITNTPDILLTTLRSSLAAQSASQGRLSAATRESV